ncbi:hypothetical protein J4421_05820 [Candidatus Woesearchaeota archaeon]|nr:hypothetical protein [Candidatus Woesearchaeota archaeon]
MDSDIRKTRTCERCKAQVPLANVRLFARDAEKNWLLCEACCDILKNKGDSNYFKKNPIKNVYKPKEQIQNIPKQVPLTQKSIKSSRICLRCKYTFDISDSGATRIRCPYCGRDDKLK